MKALKWVIRLVGVLGAVVCLVLVGLSLVVALTSHDEGQIVLGDLLSLLGVVLLIVVIELWRRSEQMLGGPR